MLKFGTMKNISNSKREIPPNPPLQRGESKSRYAPSPRGEWQSSYAPLPRGGLKSPFRKGGFRGIFEPSTITRLRNAVGEVPHR